MEAARASKRIAASQRQYVVDLLKETGLLGAKISSYPVDSNLKKLVSDENGVLVDEVSL